MKKIVVIGAGAAGAKAASKAKRLDSNNYVQIFTQGNNTSVSLCGLPYFIEGVVKDANDLVIRTPEQFLEKGIPVYTNSNLKEIFPDKKCVLVNDNYIFYDDLILATGARVALPHIKNVALKNVFTLRCLESAIKIKEKMLNSKRAIIIGGGYIALELAQAFIKNNIEVVIIESNKFLLNDFDEEFSIFIQNAVLSEQQPNIELYLGEYVSKFNSNEDKTFRSAITQSGKEINADFCVLCTGITPNVEIAKKAGIEIGSTGAIYVDNKMRTNFSNIYAAGDCTQKYCTITRKPIYMGLGTVANKEGRIAAINAVNSYFPEEFDGILASTITGFMDYSISKTGLSEKRAAELSKEINLEPISATVTKKDKAGYMPNSNEIILKIVADKRSGELLGAQAVGCKVNVAQRINTITSLLRTRATVDELLDLDLPYAPPFSGSIDPVLTAAYKLKELINK